MVTDARLCWPLLSIALAAFAVNACASFRWRNTGLRHALRNDRRAGR